MAVAQSNLMGQNAQVKVIVCSLNQPHYIHSHSHHEHTAILEIVYPSPIYGHYRCRISSPLETRVNGSRNSRT